ncbi:MAG: methionyl-tRNA formyltransferase [Actinobacteria bacterium]|nr:methionyl-tRNA formyltransferase [Actinomycetota bacterium]
MRLAYFGSPQIAVEPLHALVEAGHDIVVVVTNPERRRGRGSARTPTPVGATAERLGLTVTSDPLDAVAGSAELGVVVAYGRILGPEVLAAFPVVNLHFSLLPRWRGAAPVERAILAGDSVTGVCLMEVEPTLDTGPVFCSIEHTVSPDVTAAALAAELGHLGAGMLVDALSRGLGDPVPQATEGVTYAEKITAADRRLDWSRSASEAVRTVRIGGAWSTFRGQRVVVVAAEPSAERSDDAVPGQVLGRTGLRVACGDGSALEVLTLRPAGRKEQDASQFRNGARLLPGETFSG